MIKSKACILLFGNAICAAMIIFLAASPLHAGPEKEKVLIYNMNVTYQNPPDEDRESEKEKEKETEEEFERNKVIEDVEDEHGGYEYFSFIVPNTLAKNLAARNNYEIQRIQEILPVTAAPGSKQFFNEIDRIGKEQKARFIITGTIAVKGKKMELSLQFINVAARTMVPFSKESMETGAELKDIIVDISTDFKEKTEIIEKDTGRKTLEDTREDTRADKRERQDKKETWNERYDSPFLKAYAFFGNFSFGVRGGRYFIKGSFSRQYEDSEYISPYLSYHILKWLGVSASSDYITADNGSKFVLRKSTLLLWGSSINMEFTYWIFKFFGVQLSTGGGLSYSMIHLRDQDNPLSALQSRKMSLDPYLNMSASFKLFFRPVEIQFGSAYKSVFYRGKSLDLIAVFFGLGFRL